MMHTPQSLADMLERDYFPPNSSQGKNLYLVYDEWRMVIDALRAQRAEEVTPDAARYRWLNKQHNMLIYIEDEAQTRANVRLRCGPPLDDWIDRRIEAERSLMNKDE